MSTRTSSSDPAWKPSDAFLERLPRLLELANVPGLTVAVVEEAEVAWEAAFGLRDTATSRAMTTGTMLETASLSKPVFAHAVLGLWQEGRLDLDLPFAESLPELELSGDARRVTPRHALGQTAGFENWRKEDVPLQPRHPPGTTFTYSGEGFCLLQRLVEKLTDQSLCELLDERLFLPCGMERSTFFWHPDYERHVARGHDRMAVSKDNYVQSGRDAHEYTDFIGKPLERWRWDDMVRVIENALPGHPTVPIYILPNAAGSLLSTAGDYARFMNRIMAGEPRRGEDLETSTRALLLSPQVRLNSRLAWGLGWGLERHADRWLAWHWGDNEIFQSFALADPQRRRGIVVLTNSANGRKIYSRLIADATGEDHAAFLWYQV